MHEPLLQRLRRLTPPRVGLLLLGLACVGFGVWLAWPTPGVTRRNYDRIQVGMTEPEVEALMGGPAGLSTNRPFIYWLDDPQFTRKWLGDEACITVELGHDYEVVGKEFVALPPEPFLNRIHRVFRW